MMSRIAYLGLGLLVALSPERAQAQCRLCEGQGGSATSIAAERPIEVEVESSLDFDRLVMMGNGDGAVVLRPDGTRIVSGSLGDFTGSAMVGNVVVRGEPGRAVRIDLPRIIDLHSLSGSQVTIDQIVSDLPPLPRLDSTGRLSFRFGGRLNVNGEADGDYRGELPITADYI